MADSTNYLGNPNLVKVGVKNEYTKDQIVEYQKLSLIHI